MHLDEKFIGFTAVGDVVLFRPLHGDPVEVCRGPPDLDSHVLAAALNDAANGVLKVVTDMSAFKF